MGLAIIMQLKFQSPLFLKVSVLLFQKYKGTRVPPFAHMKEKKNIRWLVLRNFLVAMAFMEQLKLSNFRLLPIAHSGAILE